MRTRKSPAAMFFSIAAAAGAFGIAATTWAATAPIARADPDNFSEIIAQVQTDLSDGQTAFAAAEGAFASHEPVTTGLAFVASGVADDFLSAPQNFLIGVTNWVDPDDLAYTGSWDFTPVTSFSQAIDLAQSEFAYGEGYFSSIATELAAHDYGEAFYCALTAFDYSGFLPVEDILLGAGASL